MASRQHAVAWVDRYGEAWRTQSVEAILALFTEEAVYVERPYDETGIYHGHEGIKNYWLEHIQVRERNINFQNISEDLVWDESSCTSFAKWEARFEVRQTSEKPWKPVRFLQVAKLRFAPDGRVQHFEEYWHGRSLQAAKGLRAPQARRRRCGPKRRPKVSAPFWRRLFGADLGPFEQEAMRLTLRKGAPERAALPGADALEQVPVVCNALAKLSASPKTDLVAWYRRLVTASDLAEDSDVTGAPTLRPWGAFLWEELRGALAEGLAELKAQPFALPVLGHAEPPAGQEAPSLEARAAGEPLLYKAMAKWISSARDLPLILSRGVAAVTSEPPKRPLAFLRARELHVQEGHAAHSSEEEAEKFLQQVLAVYLRLCRELLALDVYVEERVAGARVVLAKIPGGALEVAAVQHLGTTAAEDFKMRFCTADAEGAAVNRACWLSSFSATQRLIAAALLRHSDHLGAALPPRLAPLQVVIIPMTRFEDRKQEEAARRCVQQIQAWCEALAAQLSAPAAFWGEGGETDAELPAWARQGLRAR
ncbi:unnamed protein product [Effrenium voratum]|nr:unnamed protein product [Effrenium voratum]